MKRGIWLVCGCIVMIGLLGSLAMAQDWYKFSWKDHSIEFKTPAGWKTTTGGDDEDPYARSLSPDSSIVVVVYTLDTKLAPRGIFEKAVKDMDLSLTKRPEEGDLNGLLIWLCEATGKAETQDAGLYVMGASYKKHKYLIYVATKRSLFKQNRQLINRILNSFTPLD